MGSFGKIVVGCDIRALAYAYKLNLPLIYTRPLEPFFLDRFSSTGGGKEILKSPDGGIPVGRLKAKEWQKYYFLLSLSGMVIYGDSVQSIFIEKNTLSVGRKNLRRKTLEFENLIIFDDYGVNGLPDMIDQVDRKNIIYDWVNVHNGHTHDYDIIQIGEGTPMCETLFWFHTSPMTKRKTFHILAQWLNSSRLMC